MYPRIEPTMLQKISLTLKFMLRIDTVLNNIVALTICIVLLIILPYKTLMIDMGRYHQLFYTCVQYLAAFQVIKSAKKSLAIPLITIAISLPGICLSHQHIWYPLNLETLKAIFWVGCIGIAFGVFYVR